MRVHVVERGAHHNVWQEFARRQSF
jgi:hypothetical protein